MRIKKLIYSFILLLVIFFIKTEIVLAQGCRDGYYCQGWRGVQEVVGCRVHATRPRCVEDTEPGGRVDCNWACVAWIWNLRCVSAVPNSDEECPTDWEGMTAEISCCVVEEEDECIRDCSPACGQADGCGGTCNNSSGGVPDAPTLTSPVGGEITVGVDEDVVVSWDPVNKADLYEYEIYSADLQGDPNACDDWTAHCDNDYVGTSVSFSPSVTNYYYLVRAVNTSCGSESSGDTTGTFTVNGLVSGQVFVLDDGATVGSPGGFCSLLGGTASGSDAGGSSVSVGGESGGVAGGGIYSVRDVPTGVGYVASLSIGDPANYSCECPGGCDQGAVTSPQAGVNFYLNNFKESWFQAEGGNLHADSGNVSSSIPDTCDGVLCEPYLILGDAGATGAVSYTGAIPETGEGDLTEDGSDWRMNTEYKGQQTGYGYFDRILEEDPAGIGSWDGDKPVGSEVVYKGEGVGRIDGDDWSVVDEEIIVILVPNDLVIDVNIDVAVGGFLAIISSGNISIGDEVTNIEGVYIADGIIATCEFECGNSEGSGDVTDEQLIVEGILVGWGGVDLRRNFASSDSNFYPTELFIYRPDLQVNAYKYLLRSHYTWEEKAP